MQCCAVLYVHIYSAVPSYLAPHETLHETLQLPASQPQPTRKYTRTVPQTAPKIHPRDEAKKSRTTSSSAPCPPPQPTILRIHRVSNPLLLLHVTKSTTPSGAALSDWQTASVVRHWAPSSRQNSHELSATIYRTAHHITRPRRVIPRRPRRSYSAKRLGTRQPRPSRLTCRRAALAA